MQISKVKVHGLFDRFNHDIGFDPDERMTIMIGPNGFGKTMILRTLNALFNLPMRSLERMPFRQLDVFFDDGSSLKATRTPTKKDSRKGRSQVTLKLDYSPAKGRAKGFTPPSQISEDELPFLINTIDDMIPALHQIGPSEWREISTGDILDLDDVLADYGEQLPFGPMFADRKSAIPPWLKEIRRAMPVHLIGTERLTHAPTHEARNYRHRRSHSRTATERTVRRYSHKLADKVQQTLTEYATLSQSLDRTFPARLVEAPTTPTLSMHDLRRELAQIEERRANIVEAGLLAQEHESLSGEAIKTVDESRQSVLAVYAQDAQRKLSVFDDLYARVTTLKRIANARLLYKQVTVGTDGLSVATSGSDIDLEMLSSGEQHELVLLYELLFDTERNSLVMIDEPELSLHVAWQEEMLNDLQEMSMLSDFRVLLATHSPQIIGDRWDLTVQLKGPNGQ